MKSITTINPYFYLDNKRIRNLKELESYVIKYGYLDSNDKKMDSDIFQSFFDYSLQTFIWNEEGFNIFSNSEKEFDYWISQSTLDKLTPDIALSFFDDIFPERNY
ncbi:hypothetical protein BUY93_13070 [Mammaliicoccus fleurettii]|nr:hypothetical protein BUY93_13070 [Mammaliicoccus fleurettii]